MLLMRWRESNVPQSLRVAPVCCQQGRQAGLKFTDTPTLGSSRPSSFRTKILPIQLLYRSAGCLSMSFTFLYTMSSGVAGA